MILEGSCLQLSIIEGRSRKTLIAVAVVYQWVATFKDGVTFPLGGGGGGPGGGALRHRMAVNFKL